MFVLNLSNKNKLLLNDKVLIFYFSKKCNNNHVKKHSITIFANIIYKYPWYNERKINFSIGIPLKVSNYPCFYSIFINTTYFDTYK